MQSRLFRTADYILQSVSPCGPTSRTFRKLFLAEQARIVRLPVERVEIHPTDADIRLRLEGLGKRQPCDAGWRLGLKVQGSNSSIRLMGWPFARRSSTAAM
jgi:hypothetical protein